jgi:hypothetical protein
MPRIWMNPLSEKPQAEACATILPSRKNRNKRRQAKRPVPPRPGAGTTR